MTHWTRIAATATCLSRSARIRQTPTFTRYGTSSRISPIFSPRVGKSTAIVRPPALSRPAPTPRNLLGFKDGTANPDASDAAAMDRLVWIAPGSPEPAWTVGGTYQVVRVIRNFVERWDRTPLQEQQSIIGRQKHSGAPLGMTAEVDIPDYAGDPAGASIRLDAHIRLANPRDAQSRAGLILRRGYNYSREVTKAGQLDMGLAVHLLPG